MRASVILAFVILVASPATAANWWDGLRPTTYEPLEKTLADLLADGWTIIGSEPVLGGFIVHSGKSGDGSHALCKFMIPRNARAAWKEIASKYPDAKAVSECYALN